MPAPAPAAKATIRARRLLEIPGPSGQLEQVVRDALKTLARRRKDELTEAEDVVEQFGLTIEVARLRDRLVGLPPTDLRRLLLATPGVPEELFLKAVKDQLEEEKEQEKRGDEQVKDESIDDLTKVLGKAFANLNDVLTDKLSGGSGSGEPVGTEGSVR
jgi:hypothetical protein